MPAYLLPQSLHEENPDPLALWQHIEAFVHFIPGPRHWYMIGDSQGLRDTLQLIGYAVLSILQVLGSNDLLKPDTPIKDTSLVLGLLMDALEKWPGEYSDPEVSGWMPKAIGLVEEHGIVLEDVPFGVEEDVEKFESWRMMRMMAESRSILKNSVFQIIRHPRGRKRYVNIILPFLSPLWPKAPLSRYEKVSLFFANPHFPIEQFTTFYRQTGRGNTPSGIGGTDTISPRR